jgi:hypothetical protein
MCLLSCVLILCLCPVWPHVFQSMCEWPVRIFSVQTRCVSRNVTGMMDITRFFPPNPSDIDLITKKEKWLLLMLHIQVSLDSIIFQETVYLGMELQAV